MGSSNFDSLIIGNNGKPGKNLLKGPTHSVDLHKTCLYVTNNETKKAVVSINNGSIELFGFRINAIRGNNQQSILFHVEYSEYVGNKCKKKVMSGIGCYGYRTFYKEAFEHFGRTDYDPTVQYDDQSDFDGVKFDRVISNYNTLEDIFSFPEDDFELTRFVGVESETLEELKKYLNELVEECETDKKYVNSIKWDELVRFNQGDAFITEK